MEFLNSAAFFGRKKCELIFYPFIDDIIDYDSEGINFIVSKRQNPNRKPIITEKQVLINKLIDVFGLKVVKKNKVNSLVKFFNPDKHLSNVAQFFKSRDEYRSKNNIRMNLIKNMDENTLKILLNLVEKNKIELMSNAIVECENRLLYEKDKDNLLAAINNLKLGINVILKKMDDDNEDNDDNE
jgi:hypothetical protein